jgi:DNA-binding Lrp family transcriptional regulator
MFSSSSRGQNDQQSQLVDEVDVKLVKLLVQDSRLSSRTIASRLGLAHTTVSARLKKLIEHGVIKRFTVLIDYEALGYQITALTLIQAEGSHIEELEKELSTHPNIVAVYDITGEFDVAVIARFKSMRQLDAFLKAVNKLPYVRRTVTSIVLRVVKEDPNAPLLAETL